MSATSSSSTTITSIISTSNSENDGKGEDSITFPNSALEHGAEYVFLVKVQNFFGYSSYSDSLSVTMEDVPIPTISIAGPSSITFQAENTLTIFAKVRVL